MFVVMEMLYLICYVEDENKYTLELTSGKQIICMSEKNESRRLVWKAISVSL